MITALFIYNPKGDVLMSKLYNEGVKRNISDVFRIQVMSVNSQHYSNGGNGGREVRSPVLTLGSTSFIYIKSGLLWICAVTRSNQDCSAILEFLYKLESLLKVMLDETPGEKVLTEDMIVNNFSLVYELLDEVVEFGYPTNLELSYLQNLLTSVSANDKIFKLPNNALSGAKSLNSGLSRRKTVKLNSLNITWRNPDIKYRRNEIFLNVEEKINVLMNSQAEVLRAYVDGKIQMKTHLSGLPECRFGLNDDSLVLNSMSADRSAIPNSGSVTLEDCKFHQSVELNKFDSDRVIQFIPPDGEFQLMSYNCMLNINLPFEVYPQVHQLGNLRVLYKLRIKSLFPSKIPATGVQIKIPTPKGVINSYSTNSLGKSKFHPEANYIIWKFNKFFGNQEHDLTAEVELPHSSDADIKNLLNWARPPIKLEFTIDMFSCSGLTVKFLRVQEKSNYRTVKWVKYTSQSGSYDIRY